MSNPIVVIDGVQYQAVQTSTGYQLQRLLFKSNEPEMPRVHSGTVFIVSIEDMVVGWIAAMTAWQAVEMSFGHPHNPRYRALAWSLCKHETQRAALDEGRIEGKIWEGCPDCQSLIATLNAQIVTLQGELTTFRQAAIGYDEAQNLLLGYAEMKEKSNAG